MHTVVTFAMQRELDEHAAAVKVAEEASTARQAVTAKTDQLTKQRDDVMVVRFAGPFCGGLCRRDDLTLSLMNPCECAREGGDLWVQWYGVDHRNWLPGLRAARR